jgi:hypothetical protein
MAEPKHEEPGSEAPTNENKGELPAVEAPPLSPASEAPQPVLDAPAATPTADTPTADTPGTDTPAAAPTADAAVAAPKRLSLKPEHKRQALAAAAVVLVAGFGAVVGALAGSAWSPPPKHDVAALQQRTAMQQSIAHLSKQVALLKADLAKANKAAHAEIASVSKRLDAAHANVASVSARLDAAHAQTANISERLDAKASPEITASIPQTVAAAPVPMPRPAPHIAAAESRPTVVLGWSIRSARSGFAYVQSHGDIYQVVPGVPLPGLGPVRSIRRQDGRWVVVTPRGIIVSQRDRRSFE